eukprot:PRCOL_00006724-RA
MMNPKLEAACANGADAVYFGLDRLNARARATNFSLEELPAVMEYVHARGVRGFVTLNVLVFDEELADAEELMRAAAAAGVDAFIVQDVGAAALAARVAPSVALHGSTQMSVASGAGARFAEALGCHRVVVGRELSVEEIARTAAGTGAEVEAFVHGALCVSYSGQCFSSEAWGGRSANRGQCAQACRLPYGLVVDGQLDMSADRSYLLSPQDLAGAEHVPALIAAGVTCLKIEGRLKGPEYVALTTRTYREAVDSAWEELVRSGAVEAPEDSRPAAGHTASVQLRSGELTASAVAGFDTLLAARAPLPRERWRALEQTFARGQDAEHRGLTPGFLEGSKHQRLVRGVAPRHRGSLVGTVARVSKGASVRLDVRVAEGARVPRAGDGVVIAAGGQAATADEEGGALYGVYEQGKEGKQVTLEFGRGAVDGSRVSPGDLVWCTSDVVLTKELRKLASESGRGAVGGRAVQARAAGVVGEPLRITYVDERTGISSTASTSSPLQSAQSPKAALSEGKLKSAIGALGATTLTLVEGGVDLSEVVGLLRDTDDADGAGVADADMLFLPAKELKSVRREASRALVEALEAAETSRVTAGVTAAAPPGEASAMVTEAAMDAMRTSAHLAGGDEGAQAASSSHVGRVDAPALTVLCRTHEQAIAASALPWVHEICLDFLEVHGLSETVAAVRDAGKRVCVATPRVIKPREEHLWRFYVRLQPDALLVRSAGLLQTLVELGGAGATLQENGSGGDGGAGPALRIPRLHGDFSLNAANAISAGQMLTRGNLDRLCLTHDLSAQQLRGVAHALGDGAIALEAVVWQHLPVFHTEHCVFCRFLSDGDNRSNCGEPCERHSVRIRDDTGLEHLVLADQGCRNTVFSAKAQSGARDARALADAGFGSLRIELVDESPADTRMILEGFRGLLMGDLDEDELWHALEGVRDGSGRAQGITRGSLGGAGDRDRSTLKPTAYASDMH